MKRGNPGELGPQVLSKLHLIMGCHGFYRVNMFINVTKVCLLERMLDRKLGDLGSNLHACWLCEFDSSAHLEPHFHLRLTRPHIPEEPLSTNRHGERHCLKAHFLRCLLRRSLCQMSHKMKGSKFGKDQTQFPS